MFFIYTLGTERTFYLALYKNYKHRITEPLNKCIPITYIHLSISRIVIKLGMSGNIAGACKAVSHAFMRPR